MERAGIKGALWALSLCVGVAAPVRALDADFLTADDLRVGGYADFGRFQLSDDDVKASDGEIISRAGARWRIDKAVNDNWAVMADLHWLFWRNQATSVSLFHIAGIKFDSDVQAALTWKGERQRVSVGLYDYKYNRDAVNLGEYLLRSEAYPTLIENSQGKDLLASANTRIMGAEYERRETAFFRHSALVYAEQYSQPVYDMTAAYLATYGNGTAEIGAGVAWARAAKFGQQDSNITIDPAMYDYIRRQGLDNEAVKFSLRGRIDVAPFLTLGESLVLYGEVALLGVKGDSLFYTDISERMPVMMGASLPTSGLLTRLAVEAEYLKNPYFDQRYRIGDGTTPLPFLPDYAVIPNYTKDDWRWSVLAHKAVNPWLDLKVRVASDHLRLRNWDGDYEVGRPLTRTTRDWYFLARVEFHN